MKAVALLALSALAVGCSLLQDAERDGRKVAAAIQKANSPIVLSVDYQPTDLGDPTLVLVTLREGSSEAQAVELICNVVRPAMVSLDLPPGFSVAVMDSARQRLLAADDEDC